MPERKENATDATKATDARHASPASAPSHEGFIPPHGGYEKLFIETRPAETVANILICLIHQANYLLDQQLKRLEQDFLREGGLRERMTRARLAARTRQRQ